MRQMKDSGNEWIGQIPQEWNTSRTKHIYQIVSGNGFKDHLQGMNDGDYPFYKVSDINGSGTNVSSAANYVSKDVVHEYRFSVVPEGALIMAKIGEALKKNHRKITDVDCIVDNNLQALVPISVIDERYFYYQFLCIDMAWFDNGGTIPSVNNQKLLNFRVVLPSLAIQKSISDHLDTKCAEIDALIEAKEKTNALLRERRQSIVYEAVTKGLNPDAPMKDSGIEWIGMIPKDWVVGKTIYGLEMPITDGPHETPQLYSEGVPFISAEAVSCGNGNIGFNHIRGYISEEYYAECCKKYIPRINDIYMIKSGATTGKVAIVDTDRKFTIWSPLAVFRCAEHKCHYKYLYYFLQSDAYQKQVEASWSFGTQQNIGMRTLERLLICFPGVNEQKEIADYLDARCSETDLMIAANEATIQKLKEYRQSIIYEAVTGKIEI